MLKPSVQVQNHNNLLVAEFWDCLRLDPLPVQDLRKHYETHLRNGGLPVLVVDLIGVGFAGSSALGNFVGLHRFARQNGGRLIFCNVEPTVSEVFRASKLESLFEFVRDREAAIQSAMSAETPRDEARTSSPNEVTPKVVSPTSNPASTETRTGIGRFRRRNE